MAFLGKYYDYLDMTDANFEDFIPTSKTNFHGILAIKGQRYIY